MIKVERQTSLAGPEPEPESEIGAFDDHRDHTCQYVDYALDI